MVRVRVRVRARGVRVRVRAKGYGLRTIREWAAIATLYLPF